MVHLPAVYSMSQADLERMSDLSDHLQSRKMTSATCAPLEMLMIIVMIHGGTKYQQLWASSPGCAWACVEPTRRVASLFQRGAPSRPQRRARGATQLFKIPPSPVLSPTLPWSSIVFPLLLPVGKYQTFFVNTTRALGNPGYPSTPRNPHAPSLASHILSPTSHKVTRPLGLNNNGSASKSPEIEPGTEIDDGV